MKYIVAHDFGTSSLKSAIYSTDGRLVRNHSEEYPSERNGEGWVEQDAENWWKAFCLANKTLTENIPAEEIACVSFDGVTAALVCCDGQGNPLHKAIMWQDGRSAAEAGEIMEMLTTPELKAGRHFMGPGRTCVQLYWVKKHWPEIFRKTASFCLNNANFVVSRLIGKSVTDYEIGSTGGLMYSERGKGWDHAFTDLLGIPPEMLPEAHWMDDIVGEVSPAMTAQVGLPAGTKVLMGGDDGRMTTLGVGIVRKGDAALTSGTSGGASVLGSAVGIPGTNAVGASFEWIRRTLCEEEEKKAKESGASVFDLIAETAARSPAGANGVLFMPYLTNERGLRRNTKTRGAFAGLQLTTTRADLLRAGIEGIVLNLSGYVRRFREAGEVITSLTANGGLTKNAFIRQLMADVVGADIVLVENASWSGPTGCAMMACVAIGEAADLEEASARFVKVKSVTKPDMALHEKYDKIYEVWEELYASQCPVYEKLDALRSFL